jgi:hypothetical protein
MLRLTQRLPSSSALSALAGASVKKDTEGGVDRQNFQGLSSPVERKKIAEVTPFNQSAAAQQ